MDNHKDNTSAPPVQPDATNLLLDHAQAVSKRVTLLAGELAIRAVDHDRSKFNSEEFRTFTSFAPKLAELVYGSKEYYADLNSMRPALLHHYKHNRHHPEHFENGIQGMNLVDLLEMFCDWCASVSRQKDGDIRKSIEENQKRFGFSDDIKCLFIHTVELFEAT